MGATFIQTVIIQRSSTNAAQCKFEKVEKLKVKDLVKKGVASPRRRIKKSRTAADVHPVPAKRQCSRRHRHHPRCSPQHPPTP
jgi:hypothetical protein